METLSNQRIFVTGATGLVGSHLVEEALAAGFEVVALVRYSSDTDCLRNFQTKYSTLQVVRAELDEVEKISKSMEGSSVVVHTAAAILPLASYDEVHTANVEGTRLIAEAAIAAKVRQLIHISSLSVIMGDTDVYGADEDSPYRFSREAYANSKIEAEKVVRDQQIASRLHVTIMRPGFIYGTNEKAWMPRVISGLISGRAMLVGNGQQETNVIFVRNLCRAIMLAMDNEVAFGETYNLTDGQKITKRQLFDTLADEMCVARVRLYIPRWTAELLVETACAIAAVAPVPIKNLLSLYSRPALRLAAINQGFDISKAETELNYIDRIPFEDGMKETCAYWRMRFPVASTPMKSHAAIAEM